MYIGRFAPSPTGPLHAGSLATALASWLDARARAGRWLVRIEDVDTPRCVPGADRFILQQLAACGLQPDESPVWQSQRGPLYQQALEQLQASGHAYPCTCSRKDIEHAQAARGVLRQRGQELPYPGSCRQGPGQPAGSPQAWRYHTQRPGHEETIHWLDRRLGAQQQQLPGVVGDFVLRRADGLWAYQLAVVVDDAAQGITHIVRGEDLADNTPRQIALQRALGLPTPQYLHTPLVLAADGQKLSKQNGAEAFAPQQALPALRQAARHLGLASGPQESPVPDLLQAWTRQWPALYPES